MKLKNTYNKKVTKKLQVRIGPHISFFAVLHINQNKKMWFFIFFSKFYYPYFHYQYDADDNNNNHSCNCLIISYNFLMIYHTEHINHRLNMKMHTRFWLFFATLTRVKKPTIFFLSFIFSSHQFYWIQAKKIYVSLPSFSIFQNHKKENWKKNWRLY